VLIKKNLIILVIFASINVQGDIIDRFEVLVKKYLTSPETLMSNFKQTIVGEQGKVIDEMSGSIMIQKPNKLRWHYKKPYEQIFIRNENRFISYDVDLDSYIIRDVDTLKLNVLRVLLNNDQKLLSEIEYLDVYEKNGILWAHLLYHGQSNESFKFTLGFQDNALSKMLIKDSLGQNMVIDFRDLILNPDINSTLFDIDRLIESLSKNISS